jgi:hypothetical protein
MIMSKQKADNGNSDRATAELGDDVLENVTGGEDASSGIKIFREPTQHPSKVFIPS